jgi:hypothetical protein
MFFVPLQGFLNGWLGTICHSMLRYVQGGAGVGNRGKYPGACR